MISKLNTVQKAFLALIIANIIWGAASAIFKLSLQNIQPYTLAFWRFFLGAILILIIMGKKISLPLASRKDGMLLFLYGFFGITVNIIFFFWGLKLTYSINAPVISSASPILTLFFALLFLHETFKLRKFIGMILGTIGICIIVIEPLLLRGIDGSIIGNIYLVIATVATVIVDTDVAFTVPNIARFCDWRSCVAADASLSLSASSFCCSAGVADGVAVAAQTVDVNIHASIRRIRVFISFPACNRRILFGLLVLIRRMMLQRLHFSLRLR